jgi:hypothetical protein
MPDSLNRYYLSDMQDRIWRLLGLKQSEVDPVTGAETNVTIQSQAISATDLTQAINSRLIALYSKMIQEREDQFTQTFYTSIKAYLAGPYGFPPRIKQLRYMDWIDPGVGKEHARPEQWVPMQYSDDPINRQMTHDNRGPMWKYATGGTAFVLDQMPTMDNPSGVRIECVVLPAPLVNPNDVIQARLVAELQEAVIFDAAFQLASKRIPSSLSAEIQEGREEWWQLLTAAAENAHKPPSTVTLSSRMPRMTYSGRRSRGRW